MQQKIIILPGNGNSDINHDNWYGWAKGKLIGLGYYVIAKNMPDPEIAHENIWLPYIKNELKADENTIIIGHSSGGVATLRYLENNKLKGAIIVGVNHTDLGDENEKESGYYDRPWQWDKIKQNAQWIVQFASDPDPYIPLEEELYINEMIGCEYHSIDDANHFMNPRFEELLAVLHAKAPIVK